MGTIQDLNELTAPAATDYFVVRDVSDVLDKDKKMLLGKVALKSGTPTAGRVASWTDANQVQDGGFAASDIARLSIAQTFALFNTFSAGIGFGQQALAYYSSGTFTPVMADAVSGGVAATLAGSSGMWVRVGRLVFVNMLLNTITTAGMTGTNIARFRTGLPFNSISGATYRIPGTAMVTNVTFSGYVVVRMAENTSVMSLHESVSAGAGADLPVSRFASGTSSAELSIVYMTD